MTHYDREGGGYAQLGFMTMKGEECVKDLDIMVKFKQEVHKGKGFSLEIQNLIVNLDK